MEENQSAELIGTNATNGKDLTIKFFNEKNDLIQSVYIEICKQTYSYACLKSFLNSILLGNGIKANKARFTLDFEGKTTDSILVSSIFTIKRYTNILVDIEIIPLRSNVSSNFFKLTNEQFTDVRLGLISKISEIVENDASITLLEFFTLNIQKVRNIVQNSSASTLFNTFTNNKIN